MKSLKKEVEEAKSEIKTIKQEGFALEIIKEQRKDKKRLFIICLCLIIALVILGTYTIYLLNDIGTIETTETEEYNQNIKDTGDINNSNINNGGVVNGNN